MNKKELAKLEKDVEVLLKQGKVKNYIELAIVLSVFGAVAYSVFYFTNLVSQLFTTGLHG